MSNHAIACGHQVTADAADAVLREGGTAADAVIAGALAAMVAEPVLAGLLGGGFCTLSDGRQTRLLDFFVHTPRQQAEDIDFHAIHADFGATQQEFHIGAGAIATPGIASGLAELHIRAGRVPFAELAAPAIAAARDGVRITAFQASLSQIVSPILTATPGSRALHCDEDGPLREGALARNPDFADVLEVYAGEGPRFVTEGEVAQALLGLSDRGGHLRMEDLKHYTPRWRAPLEWARGQSTLAINPPPSLGGSLIAFALGLLDRKASASQIAAAFQATGHARLNANDSRTLLDPALLDRYRAQLASRPTATRGTTHISVIDGQGTGAALTLSNGEGCGHILPGTGIMPNNMLGEEDLIPSARQEDWLGWPTDTRLASMMCPLAIRAPDGALTMLGSGGSNRIRTALAQVILHLIDTEASLETAIRAPRLHVEGDKVDFEEAGLSEEARTSLLTLFPDAQSWLEPSMFFGGVHGVARNAKGALQATGDPRRAGVAILG
ncbi:MAG: gamma-glutamyltransferase [Pseudomonadota bacterium]